MCLSMASLISQSIKVNKLSFGEQTDKAMVSNIQELWFSIVM